MRATKAQSGMEDTMAEQFLGGLMLGAGLIWFLDSRRGAQRRAIVRDKVVHTAHELEEAARVGSHDLAHRAEGLKAEMSSAKRPAPQDTRLEQRIRSELGRVCSHTHALRVEAQGHDVRLSGPVLASEVDEIVQSVAGVRGVEEVETDLEVHESAEGVPALQGEHVHRRPPRLPPAAHFALGTTSGLLGLAALARGSVIGFALGALGTFACARATVTRFRPTSQRRQGPGTGAGAEPLAERTTQASGT
jgi:hypothetical protein